MLASADLQLLHSISNQWATYGLPYSAERWEQTANNIKQLYNELDLEEPEIIPCRGPLKQLFYPALVWFLLKYGKENISKCNFNRTILESDLIRTEWTELFDEACELIQWRRDLQLESIGPLLNEDILLGAEIFSNPNLISRAKVRQKAAILTELRRFARENILRPIESFRNGLNYSANDRRNLWRAFSMRLPREMQDALAVNVRTGELAFDRNGPQLNAWLGLWDLHWLAISDYLIQRFEISVDEDFCRVFEMWKSLMSTATSYLFCRNCCFVYLKPSYASFDQPGRLHHSEGPAVIFQDETRLFYWHGTEVPEEVIVNPKSIKMRTIDEERNIEIKRVMIERYGIENFLFGSKKIHEDKYGSLYQKDIGESEPFVALKVTNSTPEPDGSYKTYFIRVPPEIRRAKQGVAWTFSMTEEEYDPSDET